MRLPEICCDTCPYDPTCEDERDFLRDVLGLDENGDPESCTFNL
jgi:hypothetical protein